MEKNVLCLNVRFCSGRVLTFIRNLYGLTLRFGDSPERDASVDQIVIHDDFDQPSLKNDIALIVVKPVAFDQHVQATCLPSSSVPTLRQKSTKTGTPTPGGVVRLFGFFCYID